MLMNSMSLYLYLKCRFYFNCFYLSLKDARDTIPQIAKRMNNVIGIDKIAAIYYQAFEEILQLLENKLKVSYFYWNLFIAIKLD